MAGEITVRHDGEELVVERPDDERRSRALHGLTRTLVNNMVVGVTNGFAKDLEMVGVGYRVTPKGPTTLELALGYSHPVMVEALGDHLRGALAHPHHRAGNDKEAVGEVAANIRKLRQPEPYKGKGVVTQANGSGAKPARPRSEDR